MLARHRLAILAALAAPVVALSVAGAAWAGQDRYGPPAVRDEITASEPSPVTYLSWPSKAVASTPVVAPGTATIAAPAAVTSPARSVTLRPLPTSTYGPKRIRPDTDAQASLAARPLRPAETLATATPRQTPRSAPPHRLAATSSRGPALRTQQAAPAVPEAGPTAVARSQPAVVATNGEPPRFYSVQRQFGVSPDPVPLPAQFFADGAATDLAGPPPPPAPHLISGQSASSAANVQRANAAANIADGDATTSN
ncbi:MAG TPA: hypothetical protein VGI79_06680 [Caulobacteraceae bacterium]|jgi:Meckel syndrome type 1 protein